MSRRGGYLPAEAYRRAAMGADARVAEGSGLLSRPAARAAAQVRILLRPLLKGARQ